MKNLSNLTMIIGMIFVVLFTSCGKDKDGPTVPKKYEIGELTGDKLPVGMRVEMEAFYSDSLMKFTLYDANWNVMATGTFIKELILNKDLPIVQDSTGKVAIGVLVLESMAVDQNGNTLKRSMNFFLTSIYSHHAAEHLGQCSSFDPQTGIPLCGNTKKIFRIKLGIPNSK